MPEHLVADDIRAGRLVRLAPESWDGGPGPPRLPTVLLARRDAPLGPAGQWLREALLAGNAFQTDRAD